MKRSAVDTVRAPLEAGARVNALHRSGHEALTRQLHAAGISAREPNSEGKTCLDLTREAKPHMVPIIEELLAAESASEH